MPPPGLIFSSFAAAGACRALPKYLLLPDGAKYTPKPGRTRQCFKKKKEKTPSKSEKPRQSQRRAVQRLNDAKFAAFLDFMDKAEPAGTTARDASELCSLHWHRSMVSKRYFASAALPDGGDRGAYGQIRKRAIVHRDYAEDVSA
ncbi:hypothetical protein GGX14DRAFT_398608 [Mycena pura]|uniref:Uncharacterized protein n=1 Tax=Mycena pura TaxID=153505 RepID=A0AAD6YBF9_9AGAR|nr:hypothetical protein GGX14DRAFT_398608 [Mycena pura]